MMDIGQFQEILADSIFMGNTEVAGMIIYAVVLGIIFAMTKSNLHALIIMSIPISLIFTILGLLSTELAMIMIVIAVLALAMGAKKTFAGSD